jgi:hypothetical protein
MMSAANQQKLWFADGINYAGTTTPATDTVYRWTGVGRARCPADGDDNTPRLICTWRGRTVLSGLLLDPQNWFMSKVGDPTDFDYAPLSPSSGQAVAGNNAPRADRRRDHRADPVLDDVLIFGGDHDLHDAGRPGGRRADRPGDRRHRDRLGRGVVPGPDRTIYFFSNRTGVFTLVPGSSRCGSASRSTTCSTDIDTGGYGVRLLWNDRFQGVHVFVTPLAAPGATTHFFWETRTGAWWQDTFANHRPRPAVLPRVLDGNLPTDRVALIGCWDGYVRAFDPAATDDDGTAIASEVWIGPLLTDGWTRSWCGTSRGCSGRRAGR